MPTQLGIEAIWLALSATKPLAVDLGGCALDALRAYGTLKARVFAPIAFRQAQDGISRSQWVSYVTQEYLQHRYPAAPGAQTIGCSNVDLPAVAEGPLRHRLERLAVGARPLIFGTVGSLHGQFKGVQHALAALGQVRTRLPAFQYRVLGGGDPAPWLGLAKQNGLSEHVVLDGTLPAGQPVLEWLDQVDIYLQPSLREGVPRALIEAMSRGCPAIASDIAGIPELLPAEVLHGAGDVKRLAALIEASVAPEFIRTHGVRNWERAKDFTGERLDAIRDEFWGAFAAEARVRKDGLGRQGS
jgi:glycosyltransferase involved in cell wall biosynthesis